MSIRIPTPFADELADGHLYRTWALNDTSGFYDRNKSQAWIEATRHRRPVSCTHPWTPLYLHQILAFLSGMTPQDYRARHTLLPLRRDWDEVYNTDPVKESKTDVFGTDLLSGESPASAYYYKLCPLCRDEDLRMHSMTYWHREHHIPGIDICPTHQTPLEQLKGNAAQRAPNPAALKGEPIDEELYRASSHPILVRYRTLMVRVLKNPDQVQFIVAQEELQRRAADMELCRREQMYTGAYYENQDGLYDYLYRHLPRAWMRRHFSNDFFEPTFVPSRNCEADYHSSMKSIFYRAFPPTFLILALAALFESTEQIMRFLFKTDLHSQAT